MPGARDALSGTAPNTLLWGFGLLLERHGVVALMKPENTPFCFLVQHCPLSVLELVKPFAQLYFANTTFALGTAEQPIRDWVSLVTSSLETANNRASKAN